MPEEKFKSVELLCRGFVILVGNKKGVEYIVLNEKEEEVGERMIFSVKKSTKGYPGDIYDAELSGKTMMGLTFNRVLKDKERTSFLLIRSKARETELRAVIQQKKAELDDSAMYDLLKPLREAYHSTDSLGKSALIARVINIMQSNRL